MIPLKLEPDRLFSPEPGQRALARALYATVKDLPIVSPHGHTDPQWFGDDAPFSDASSLLITPDHYVFRMLYSQGVRLEDLGIARHDGDEVASEAVKNKIKSIIVAEDPKHPHSDQKIVELLRDQNIDIARRTVAKYREQLGILSSSKRKQVF